MQEDKVKNYYDYCLSDYESGWGINEFYAVHYGYYDERAYTHKEAVTRYNEVLAEKAHITKDDIVLDAGCGVGGSAIWLAKNKGCKVTGINIHKPQIEKAIINTKKEKVEHLTNFIEATYLHTPFSDNSFTVVWAIESVCHAENKKKFLEEAARVLRPGGRIIIADYFLLDQKFSKLQFWHLRKWLKGWAMPNLAYINEFKTYLEETGFHNIVFTDVTEHILPSSKKMYDSVKQGFYKKKLMVLLGKRSYTQKLHSTGTAHQYKIIGNMWRGGIYYAELKK